MVVRFADVAQATFSPASGPKPGLVAGVGAAAVAAAAVIDPATVDDGPVICPFRLLTGLPCPGCGLTRSWAYLMHGHWSDGVAANPFGILTLLSVVAVVVAVSVALVRRRAVPDLGRFTRSRLVWAVLAGWVVFGVVRAVAVLAGVATV